MAEIRSVSPDAAPYDGAFVTTGEPEAKNRKTARLILSCKAGKCFSRLSVAVINGWTIEQRVTGPIDQATFGDLLAETSLVRLMRDVTKGGVLPSTPPPGKTDSVARLVPPSLR